MTQFIQVVRANRDRRSRIGGTAISAILGKNPWQTREATMAYYLGGPGPVPNRYMEWGLRGEAAVANAYADKNDLKLVDLVKEEEEDLLPGQIVRHPEVDFLAGSPDRLVLKPGLDRYRAESKNGDEKMRIISGISHGLEIKTASAWSKKKWDMGIPEHYVMQCQFYLMITGLPRWDIAVLIGGNDYRDFAHSSDGNKTVKGEYSNYVIEPDLFLHAQMVEEATKFWEEVKNEREKT